MALSKGKLLVRKDCANALVDFPDLTRIQMKHTDTRQIVDRCKEILGGTPKRDLLFLRLKELSAEFVFEGRFALHACLEGVNEVSESWRVGEEIEELLLK